MPKGLEDEDYITLKWGTLKSWRLTSEKAKKILSDWAGIVFLYLQCFIKTQNGRKN